MTGPPFRTFDEAKEHGAYKLARRWTDVARVDGSAAAGLDELATMAVLAYWLTRWIPIQIHQSLFAGASIEEVAAAAGVTFSETTRLWREWSDGQRHLQHAMPSLPDHSAEHDQVDELIRRAAHDRTLPQPKGNLRLPKRDPGREPTP